MMMFTGDWNDSITVADPMLGSTTLSAPDFVPAAGGPASMGAGDNPGGFFEAAAYLGAFEPGGSDWTAGWTAYPASAE